MSGYPGVSWPPPFSGSQGGSETPASEGALRALRDERSAVAQGIGEYLYRMVMSGQVRDPAVIDACRPLYDIAQRILRLEAVLGTSPANREEAVTALAPGQQQPWQSGPTPASDASPPRRSPSASNDARPARDAHTADRECSHCRMPLKATDRVCPVCGRDTADAISLAPATAVPKAASPVTRCQRCGTDLRPQDRVCPVCGTAQSSS